MAYSVQICVRFALALVAGPMVAQTPQALSFEAASVRPASSSGITPGNTGHSGMKTTQSSIDARFMTAKSLIGIAYRIKLEQVLAPAWLDTDRFDVVAKFPTGGSKDQIPEMMQTLLAERFGLKLHRAIRDLPIYALTIAKDGPKLVEATAPGDSAEGNLGSPVLNELGVASFMSIRKGGVVHVEMPRASTTMLCGMLAVYVDRPIVDKTGLKSWYRIGLDLFSTMPFNTGETTDRISTVLDSVKPFGLRLEPRKDALEIVVVDHMDRLPKEN